MTVMNPYNYKKPIGAVTKTEVSAQEPEIVTQTKLKSDAYLEQKIMNAKPEELTLMLYEGLVKFINQCILFNEQKIYDKSSNSNLRAQAIVQELRSTLNLEITISESLEALYVYMMEKLVDANINKNNSYLNEVLSLATDLRDTWKQAMNL